MPTYDYKCKDCGHEFEEFQSISAAPLTECPVCNGTIQRVISGGTGLIFKGSGFYITDYPNKNEGQGGNSSAESPDSKTSTDSKKTTESKSDSKPAKTDKSAGKKAKSDSSKESS